jgi:CHAD domain-containing protein
MARLHPLRSVQANARRILPRAVRRYLRAGRRLVRRHPDFLELHQFRIRTKRLRYVFELYAEVFPRPLRGALREFRGIQGVLGQVQDQTMVIAYFEERLMHVRTPGRQTEYLRVLHRARVRQNAHRAAFFRRWNRLERIHFERRLLEGIERVTRIRRTLSP